MSNFSEVGRAKNVTNFEELISRHLDSVLSTTLV